MKTVWFLPRRGARSRVVKLASSLGLILQEGSLQMNLFRDLKDSKIYAYTHLGVTTIEVRADQGAKNTDTPNIWGVRCQGERLSRPAESSL
jgi:hypothetical protein